MPRSLPCDEGDCGEVAGRRNALPAGPRMAQMGSRLPAAWDRRGEKQLLKMQRPLKSGKELGDAPWL